MKILQKIGETILDVILFFYDIFHKENEKKDKSMHKEILRANGYKYDLPRAREK